MAPRSHGRDPQVLRDALLGLLRCQSHGIAGIGFESALVLLIYVGSVVLLFV